MLSKQEKEITEESPNLKEGSDYTINENGLLVWTEQYLLDRGYCCGNGCQNCPYGFK